MEGGGQGFKMQTSPLLHFESDLKDEIKEMNRDFIRHHKKAAEGTSTSSSSGQGKDDREISSPRSPAPLAKSLTVAIDALLSFILECTRVRENPQGAFGRFILRSEMERFRELDMQVFLLADDTADFGSIPKQDELQQQMYAPDVPMCRPNDPDVPLVQIRG